MEIQRGLLTAIEDGSLSLQFQPKHDSRSGRVVGAEALARWTHPLLGRRLAGGVHRCRRTQRPDRPHRRVGDPRSLPAARRLAQARAAADSHRDQPVAAAAQPARAGRHRRTDRCRDADRSGTDHVRDHREHGDGKRRAHHPHAEGLPRAWLRVRHRRFRHRLFQPGVSAEVPGAPAEDRPVLRPGTGRGRSRGARHHRRDHRAGAYAQHGSGGRGRGDRVAVWTCCARSDCDQVQGYFHSLPMPPDEFERRYLGAGQTAPA